MHKTRGSACKSVSRWRPSAKAERHAATGSHAQAQIKRMEGANAAEEAGSVGEFSGNLLPNIGRNAKQLL